MDFLKELRKAEGFNKSILQTCDLTQCRVLILKGCSADEPDTDEEKSYIELVGRMTVSMAISLGVVPGADDRSLFARILLPTVVPLTSTQPISLPEPTTTTSPLCRLYVRVGYSLGGYREFISDEGLEKMTAINLLKVLSMDLGFAVLRTCDDLTRCRVLILKGCFADEPDTDEEEVIH